MTDSNMPPANSGGVLDIETEVQKVSSLIATARRLLAANKMVDLSALSGKVMSLCEAINRASPPENSDKIISAVDEISGDLDRLAEELTSQYNGVNAIFQDAAPNQVISAYVKAKDKT
ncbi:MAG: hypothetical protein OEY85_05740 [Rhodospirillales bacterium]|nr:hypothetical protein [Rhodospirillales bacterium]